MQMVSVLFLNWADHVEKHKCEYELLHFCSETGRELGKHMLTVPQILTARLGCQSMPVPQPSHPGSKSRHPTSIDRDPDIQYAGQNPPSTCFQFLGLVACFAIGRLFPAPGSPFPMKNCLLFVTIYLFPVTCNLFPVTSSLLHVLVACCL